MESPKKRPRNGEDVEETLLKLTGEPLQTTSGEIRIRRAKDDLGTAESIRRSSKALSRLYSSSVESKIWGVAEKCLSRPTPPVLFPEYTIPGGTEYVYRDLGFWTSGFFPGSLYLLLERKRKYQNIVGFKSGSAQGIHELQLEFACKWWTESLHQNAALRATHDLGFMIMPWAKMAWELNRDAKAFATLKAGADSLLSRYNETVGCIRSWDICVTKVYNFKEPETEFLMIIDNMMNLNFLFYVAAQTGNKAMYAAAVQHARTTQRTHIRADASTIHLVEFDPATGDIRQRLTNQGYTQESCWARGQAWGICGFAETYLWTQEREFLSTAMRCADYFLDRLPESGIPPWDFDAAETEEAPQPPDTSAGMIVAYGLLLIHQALTALGHESRYLASALNIAESISSKHMNAPAGFVMEKHVVDTVEYGTTEEITGQHVDMGVGDTILNGATINNYQFAPRRWANHGLVYADYFFLLFGNKLLEMGIGSTIMKHASETNGAANGRGNANSSAST